MSTPLHVAFIGLGIMGAPMAGHIASAGGGNAWASVRVHSRTRAKVEPLLGKHPAMRWCDTPADAARGADVVCLCVPDTADVERVLFGAGGVAEAAGRGAVVVDHSTISPTATREMARRLAESRGAALVDAPVSGGDVGARNGTLSIMVGADDAASLEKARPVLQCYGKTITHCGGSGAGQFTKLINQILVSVTLAGVCEALNFAGRAGIDLGAAVAATSGGAAASWQLANLGPKIAAGDFAPGFMIDLLVKDLGILAQAADSVGAAPLRVTSLVQGLFKAAQADGLGREGTQAVFKVIQRGGPPA